MVSEAYKLASKTEVTIEIDGKTISLPLVEGSEGELALDIAKLRAQTGVITFDSGYGNTGSCKSAITFLDGEQGILRYRGYPIEQLAKQAPFIEIAYLLRHGTLPRAAEFNSFMDKIISHGDCHPVVIDIIKAFPHDAHPMTVIASALNGLAGVYPDLCQQELTAEQADHAHTLLLAQTKNIVAYTYRHLAGLPFVGPEAKNRSYCADFLHMLSPGAKAAQEPSDVAIDALNALLILHADHEQNCSASAVRLVGSSKAPIFSAMASGVNALWGPLHGGANQAVIEMLEHIAANGGKSAEFIARAKDKADPFKLMGFGHRVYKNFDPRAKIIKSSCDTLLSKLGINDPLLTIAKELEQAALNDPYFVDRKLYPNVDFYSGIIYKALGIPTTMFTPMFVLGRLPGWLAQWQEMRDDTAGRIGRPRQIYVGEQQRDYVQIHQR